MTEDARWYVIHTYSGYENKVAANLEKIVENRRLYDLIPDIKVPTELVTEVKDDQKREVERKLFPSYVLVKMVMTDESWYVVRNVRGVTGFVGPSSKPVPLTDAEVAALHVEAQPEATLELDFDVGDSVKIMEGPLSGFIGVVDEIQPEKNKLKVTVSMFGRDTPAEIEIDQAEALAY